VGILQCDPALAAKVLRMANSAYFAARREIGELTEAVVRLGLRRVQMMALAFCIMDATSGDPDQHKAFNYNYFWNHALVTGTLADVVANARRTTLAVEAMIAGLLQDIGVLIIQTNMPEAYRQVLSTTAKEQTELHVAETRHLGFNHMQAGQLLLTRWRIPESICLAAGHHHQPETIEEAAEGVGELARTCHLGAAVGKLLTAERGRRVLHRQTVELAGRHFGMSETDLQSLLGLVRMKLEASAQMFNLRLDELMVKRLDAAIRDRLAEGVMEMSDMSGLHS
jgi:HD-like signal output (HDOD) protein